MSWTVWQRNPEGWSPVGVPVVMQQALETVDTLTATAARHGQPVRFEPAPAGQRPADPVPECAGTCVDGTPCLLPLGHEGGHGP